MKSIIDNVIPLNDAKRVDALHRYKILDIPADEAFNNIARIMADVFGVPIALISLVDKDRVFFKGNVGMAGVHYTDRTVSLCSFAILSNEVTVFENPLDEPCLLTNPMVHGKFGLRFYAGAPLTTCDGYNIGSVCLVDKKERTFSAEEQATLTRFARLVMNEIELRHTALLQYEFEKALMQSKERFELVAKATQDAIWDWDLKTDKLWWNEGFKSLFGYRAEEIESDISSWSGRVHPDDRERVVQDIHNVIDKGEKHWAAEYRFRKKDGTYAIVFDRGYVLHDQAEKAYRMLGSMQDITERKQLEDTAREAEARTRLAVESAHMGTYEINLGQQTIIHSPRAAEIFGLDPSKQWSYKTFVEAVHPEDVEIREKAHEVAERTGQLFYECRILLPDHSTRWIRLNGVVLEQGEATFLIGTTLDITEEKEAASLLEKKIQERTTELNRANEQLKQFAYAASHDLQEPLRKISYFVDRLLTNAALSPNEENKRISDRIQHTIVRMRKLIDDLLEYSNTALRSAAYVDVDLNDILREVLDDMEATILETGAVVHLDVMPVVKGDARQLKQLFQNLISNSIKYHKKEETPCIQIRSREISPEALKAQDLTCSENSVHVEIEVKDNGIGFAQEDAKRIFSLFQRLHGKSEYEGTGVGLAIVQKVVENHNGCVRAEAEPGQGATFRVILPYNKNTGKGFIGHPSVEQLYF